MFIFRFVWFVITLPLRCLVFLFKALFTVVLFLVFFSVGIFFLQPNTDRDGRYHSRIALGQFEIDNALKKFRTSVDISQTQAEIDRAIATLSKTSYRDQLADRLDSWSMQLRNKANPK